MNSYHVVDDQQGQGTYRVVDFYGQPVSNIGLPFEAAVRLAASLNAGEL